MTEREVYEKILGFCAYRERCTSEVKEKLKSLHMYGNPAERIMERLRNDDVLNDERFARIYTGSRFRLKYWGKVKICLELRRKGIAENCIQKAAESEIDPTEYMETLRKLLNRKSEQLKETNPLLKNQKLMSYAFGKGYEPNIIREVLKEDSFL